MWHLLGVKEHVSCRLFYFKEMTHWTAERRVFFPQSIESKSSVGLFGRYAFSVGTGFYRNGEPVGVMQLVRLSVALEVMVGMIERERAVACRGEVAHAGDLRGFFGIGAAESRQLHFTVASRQFSVGSFATRRYLPAHLGSVHIDLVPLHRIDLGEDDHHPVLLFFGGFGLKGCDQPVGLTLGAPVGTEVT